MAVEVLKPKIEATGYFDLVGIGVAKLLEDKLTMGIIGNGTFFSGIVKGILGGVIDGHGGHIGRIVSGGFGVGAGEDIAYSILSMVGVMPGGYPGGSGGLLAGTGIPGMGGGQQSQSGAW